MALLATKGMSQKTSSERQKGFKGSWGFAAGSFARELGRRKTLFYFWYTKGLIPNPPNTLHSRACAVAVKPSAAGTLSAIEALHRW
jgi:hypothetical protein